MKAVTTTVVLLLITAILIVALEGQYVGAVVERTEQTLSNIETHVTLEDIPTCIDWPDKPVNVSEEFWRELQFNSKLNNGKYIKPLLKKVDGQIYYWRTEWGY